MISVQTGDFDPGVEIEKLRTQSSGRAGAVVSFDHDKTEFPLVGRHQTTTCKQCHERDLIVLGSAVSTRCSTCHDDIHVGQFAKSGGVDCARGHTSDQWKAKLFVHDRDSRFALDGAHEGVSCDQCHKQESGTGGTFVRYKPMEPQCATCHG